MTLSLTQSGDVPSPEEFVRCIHRDEDGWIVIWGRHKKNRLNESHYFRPANISEAIRLANTMSESGMNVFVSLNRQASEGAKNQRGKSETVVCLNGLAIDLDLACQEKKGNYPTEEEAYAAIQAMPLLPAFILRTGAGLLLIYLLDAPFALVGDDRIEKMARANHLLTQWWQLLKSKLPENYQLDVCKDLSRVVRLPGTINHRWNKPVEIEYCDLKNAQSIEAFERWIPRRSIEPRPVARSVLASPSSQLVERILAQADGAAPNGRNAAGFQLACQLRDNGFSRDEAWAILRDWQRSHESGSHPYTETEARRSLEQAFSAQPRDPWAVGRGNSSSVSQMPTGVNRSVHYVTPEELFQMNRDAFRRLLDEDSGVFLNRAGMGGSKTRAAIELTHTVHRETEWRTIYATTTHQFGQEIYEYYQLAGIPDAFVLPKRTSENCHSDPKEQRKADRQEAMGINPCVGCPLLEYKSCGFQREMAKAATARQLIMTSDRLLTGQFRADLVIVDERAYDIVARTTAISKSDLLNLKQVLAYAKRYSSHPGSISAADYNANTMFQAIDRLAERLLVELIEAETTRQVQVDSYRLSLSSAPWQTVWWQANQTAISEKESPASGEVFKALVRIVTGKIEDVWVRRVPNWFDSNTQEVTEFAQHIVVTHRPNVLEFAPRVLLLDGTARYESLSRMTSIPIIDITPEGQLRQQHAVDFFPGQDVKASTGMTTVRAILRAAIIEALRRDPLAKIGVIGHQQHIDDLQKTLEVPFRQKVVKWSYFGSGIDTGSNAWQRECTILLVLGTVRYAIKDVADHLIRCQKGEAAKRDGRWGEIPWNDIDGKKVKGLGYADPDWQMAREDLAGANNHQVIARSRFCLPDGIPVLVFSSDAHPNARTYPSFALLKDRVAASIEKIVLQHELGSGEVTLRTNPLLNNNRENVPTDSFLADLPNRQAEETKPSSKAVRKKNRDVELGVALGLLERKSDRSPARPTELAKTLWSPSSLLPAEGLHQRIPMEVIRASARLADVDVDREISWHTTN